MTEKCVRCEWQLVWLNPLIFEMNPAIFVIDRWRSNRLSIVCDNRIVRIDAILWYGVAPSSRRYVGGFHREIENYANIISDTVQSAPKKRRRGDVRSCVRHYRKTAARGARSKFKIRCISPATRPSPHVMPTSLLTNSLPLSSFRFLFANFSLKLR